MVNSPAGKTASPVNSPAGKTASPAASPAQIRLELEVHAVRAARCKSCVLPEPIEAAYKRRVVYAGCMFRLCSRKANRYWHKRQRKKVRKLVADGMRDALPGVMVAENSFVTTAAPAAASGND